MAHQVMPRKAAVLLPIMLFLSHSPSSPCVLHTHTVLTLRGRRRWSSGHSYFFTTYSSFLTPPLSLLGVIPLSPPNEMTLLTAYPKFPYLCSRENSAFSCPSFAFGMWMELLGIKISFFILNKTWQSRLLIFLHPRDGGEQQNNKKD